MKNVMTVAYELKEELEKDQRLVALKKIEQEMENDEAVMALSYHFSVAQTEYNDTLKHYSENSLEVKEAQKKLHLTKKELDEHYLVTKYLQAYSEVRQLYEHIDEHLFAKFMKHKCEKK